MHIAVIREAILAHRVRITDHADEEANADGLKLDDVYFSVANGEIIENYPSDRPFPSCLILGATEEKAPIHSVWAYNPLNRWAVLVTMYRPDPNRWVDYRKRKEK
jgi:Domain of unknown function (DUF4258)